MFDFFLDKANGIANGLGSLWLLPVFFWAAYFFWSHFLDYPADLEKHIRNGKTWPYLPMYWKGSRRKLIRAVSILFFWGGNLFCACTLYYLFKHFLLLIVGLALSIFVGIKIRSFGTKEFIRLQQDRYFQNYTQLASQAVSKGDEISDSELLARTQWRHHNDLRLADRQGRLLPFLRGEARL